MSRFDLSKGDRIKLAGREVYLMQDDNSQIVVDNSISGVTPNKLVFDIKFS